MAKPSEVIWHTWDAYKEGWPVICNEGGSRSGKSYSTIQILVSIATTQPNKRISIVSHSLPHIKRGAWRDLKTILEETENWHEDWMRWTDFVYSFPNGSYIELFGLEDEGKARGPGRDILFINEANLINRMLFDQLAMRTTGTIFLDWNPADFRSWVYELADDPKNKRIHSTYLDNLHNLSPNQIAQIEGYRDMADPFMWKVYGLGERGASAELIYTRYKTYTDEVEGYTCWGLDFGFNHPNALIKVTFVDGIPYVKEAIYKSNMTTPELIAAMKAAGVGRDVVYCDHAKADLIEELTRAGFLAKKADKDVFAGIMCVKSTDLHIYSSSKNLIAEMQSYKWQKDKNDEITEVPVKANDDACDALRYAIFSHLGKPKLKYFSI